MRCEPPSRMRRGTAARASITAAGLAGAITVGIPAGFHLGETPNAPPDAPPSVFDLSDRVPADTEAVSAPAPAPIPERLADEVRWFNGRAVRPARQLRMVVTAYSPDERSCGRFADGITASGYSVWTNGMKLAAADTSLLPFGSLISVPGYDGGAVVPVLDRGGAIKGHRLDMLYPTHASALEWGVQELDVTVWEYVDGAPTGG